MAFTGTALRTAKLDLTLLGCESLITCSPLVRLGDKGQTIISARISNGDPTLDLTGWEMGFEATVGDKLIRDENQSRFRLVGKNIVEYKCSDEVHSFIGTVNVAYFTLKKDGTTATTQNFTIHSLQNAETGTDGLKEHYVSVIDDLVKSNGEAMGKAEEIKGLIDKNQVVRKSGDSMSGNLEFDRTKGVLFKNGDGISVMSLTADSLNRFVGFSDASNENVFVYDPATKFFDLRTGSNLLKTTGGTLSGMLSLTNTRGLEFLTPTSKFTVATSHSPDNPNRIYMFDSINNKTVWDYNANNGGMWTFAGETNLLKNTGGTMTGDLAVNKSGAATKKFAFQKDGVETFNLYNFSDTHVGLRDVINNRNVWEYNTGTGSFDILAGVNTNLMKKTDYTAKDGRAELTLTANGENFNGNIGPMADRYGNTVTFRAGIRRKPTGTGPVMTVLPTNMRPTMTIMQVIPATDGTLARVTIQTNGDVQLESAGNVSIIGKDVYMTITYVAN
ncbi:BppU family phage baseplate upper protein [Bacillus cereus]|uniref:BppU family phage baseplate upper protein n=1 Tax=Bacillus cereus TaxID=1396 RepID=UPI0024073479|nr:BppU family phage baseplate upper protein [Bacillus cereus]MDF9611910.1 BppU family phage baseplate upper protein [Bacillus cereus]